MGIDGELVVDGFDATKQSDEVLGLPISANGYSQHVALPEVLSGVAVIVGNPPTVKVAGSGGGVG